MQPGQNIQPQSDPTLQPGSPDAPQATALPTFGQPISEPNADPASTAQMPVFGAAPAAATAPVSVADAVQPAATQSAVVDTDSNLAAADMDGEGEQVDDDVLLSWQNDQQEGAHHPSQWYIIMGCIAAAAIVAAIFLKSWFFIPLGILVPIALTKYSSRGTDAHSYQLTTFTISIDGKHYPYDAFKSFFEVESNGVSVFELIPTKRFAVLITLHTTPEVADDVAEILSSVLPESEPEGYFGESIFKWLKF